MSKGAFGKFAKEARRRDSYWVEKAIIDFTCDLEGFMKAQGVSKSELARKIDSSPAYITKVLRGNANFTIESLVKLSRAVGGKLHLHVAKEEEAPLWLPIAFKPVEVSYPAETRLSATVEIGDEFDVAAYAA